MNDSDFRQFEGAFDAPRNPDAALLERLQKSMVTQSQSQSQPRLLAGPVTVSTPRPVRQERQLVQPRRSHPLYIAAAALVVLALAVASIAQLAPRVIEPQYASEAQATLPAGVNSTPGPDVSVSAEPVAELKSVGYTHPYGGNLIAVRYVPPTDAQRLLSYNLQSGAVVWEQDVSDRNHFVFGENVVVAVTYVQPDVQDMEALPKFGAMTGYDIVTGDKLWTRSIADLQIQHGWETVFLSGDTVVVLLAGNVVGMSATTGETLWQAEYDLSAPGEDGWVKPPSLAGIDGQLYVAQISGAVEVFDLVSGAKLREFELPASLQDTKPAAMQLFEVPAGLLVAIDSFAGPGPRTHLLVVDPETGGVVWQRSLDSTGVMDVAQDGSIAIGTHTWESPPLLLRLLGREGHSTAGLTWLDPNGEVLLETDRVRLPDMFGIAVAGNSDYICGSAEQFTCFDRSGTKYVFGNAMVLDAVWVQGTLLLVTDRGVLRADLP